MAKSLLDRAKAAGFDLKENSGNQGIAEKLKILKITNHRLKSIKSLFRLLTIDKI